MSLVNFNESSLAQLRALLGSFGDDEISRAVKQTVPYVESRWFKVTEEVEVTEGEETFTEYKATEVYPDGKEVPYGIVFDSDATPSTKPDEPTYFKNLKINTDLYTGAIEVNKAYQVEAVWGEDYGSEITYYVIPKGGGGSMLYAYIKSGSSNKYTVDVYSQPTLDDKFKVDEDIEALAYNVTYGDISHNNFLIFSYGIDESSGTDGYLTSSVWL